MRTLEAVVNKKGKIKLLSEIRLEEDRRALVTILNEQPHDQNANAIELPLNEPVSDDDVLSVWANRKGTAQDIAKKLRKANRQTK